MMTVLVMKKCISMKACGPFKLSDEAIRNWASVHAIGVGCLGHASVATSLRLAMRMTGHMTMAACIQEHTYVCRDACTHTCTQTKGGGGHALTRLQAIPELDKQAHEPCIPPVEVHPFGHAQAGDDSVPVLAPAPLAARAFLHMRRHPQKEAAVSHVCQARGTSCLVLPGTTTRQEAQIRSPLVPCPE